MSERGGVDVCYGPSCLSFVVARLCAALNTCQFIMNESFLRHLALHKLTSAEVYKM